jgi:RNA polymerase sigma-70 factor (ECF subfamily)
MILYGLKSRLTREKPSVNPACHIPIEPDIYPHVRFPDQKEDDVGAAERRRFEELYTEHYGAVSAYVHRRTDRSDGTADVIAETFTTVWRRLGDVPRGDQARPWLYGVARRVLANHRRGESRRTALAQRLRDELAAWQPPPPGQVPHEVREAFSRLPDADRELLTLVVWEGLGAAEIATVLGCSRMAARQRLHRARKRFAAELDAADLDAVKPGTAAPGTAAPGTAAPGTAKPGATGLDAAEPGAARLDAAAHTDTPIVIFAKESA